MLQRVAAIALSALAIITGFLFLVFVRTLVQG